VVWFRNRRFSGLFGRNRAHFKPLSGKNFYTFAPKNTPVIAEAEEPIKWKISVLKEAYEELKNKRWEAFEKAKKYTKMFQK